MGKRGIKVNPDTQLLEDVTDLVFIEHYLLAFAEKHSDYDEETEEWSNLQLLNNEKELIGIYLSAHPLDDFKLEIDHFANTTIAQLKEPEKLNGKELVIAGMVTAVKNATTKNIFFI